MTYRPLRNAIRTAPRLAEDVDKALEEAKKRFVSLLKDNGLFCKSDVVEALRTIGVSEMPRTLEEFNRANSALWAAVSCEEDWTIGEYHPGTTWQETAIGRVLKSRSLGYVGWFFVALAGAAMIGAGLTALVWGLR